MRNSQRRLFFTTQSLDWDKHSFWLFSCIIGWIIIFQLLLGLWSFECPDILWGSYKLLLFASPGHVFFHKVGIRIQTLEDNTIAVVALSVWKLALWFLIFSPVIFWCIKALSYFFTNSAYVLKDAAGF